MRTHVIYTFGNAEPRVVPFTAEEEAAADAAAVPLVDLNRIQFEFMVEKLGLDTSIKAAIEAMPEGTELEQNAKILARVLYRSGQKFERSHPLFTELAPSVGLTTEQIDGAWLAALSV